jgi:hypothetical protein
MPLLSESGLTLLETRVSDESKLACGFWLTGGNGGDFWLEESVEVVERAASGLDGEQVLESADSVELAMNW